MPSKNVQFAALTHWPKANLEEEKKIEIEKLHDLTIQNGFLFFLTSPVSKHSFKVSIES